MKKAISLILAVMLVFSLCAVGAGAADEATVYVTVSIGSEVVLAAQPVTISDLTVHGALVAAHELYYADGLAGFTAGPSAMYGGMYLIDGFWGYTNNPYVILNDGPLGYGSNDATLNTADVAPVKDGDNIIISDNMGLCVSLDPVVSGDSCTITALSWTLNFMTFTYTSAPLAGADVVDVATGASLGTTDSNGQVTVPNYGTVAVGGVAAIYLGEAPVAEPEVPAEPEAPAEEPEAPVEEPEAPVEEPEAPVEEPEAPVEEPEAPVEEPEAPVEEPEAPVEEPEAPVVAPPASGDYDNAAGTYTVAAGDCLWTICEAVYGNGAKWGEVWAANAATIANPRLIYVGQVIIIP